MTNCTISTFHLTFILLYLYECSYLIISVIISVDDKVYTWILDLIGLLSEN